MKLTNFWLFCLFGFICLSTLAQCTGSDGLVPKTLKHDTTSEQSSSIYRIKRLDNKDKFAIQKQQKHQKLQQQQQQQQQLEQQTHYKNLQHEETKDMQKPIQSQKENQEKLQQIPNKFRNNEGNHHLTPQQRHSKKGKKVLKNPHGLNKKLLSKLGFTKVKAPNSHNRKRLAVESRRHASPDDSHMFIIKLPPNHHYYSNPNANNIIDNNNKNSLTVTTTKQSNGKPQPGVQTKSDVTQVLESNGKKVTFPANGRPGRIYHWNLPVIKKILDDKQRFAHIRESTKQQLTDIKNIPTWSKPWENDTFEKSYSSNKANYKKSLKQKSPSYYAPANTVNKNSFHKYFAGNGKPKGFYVIKENQKKPLYYKNIIS